MKKPSKTTATVTDEQLRDLIEEAAPAGDAAQVDLCHAALWRAVRTKTEATRAA